MIKLDLDKWKRAESKKCKIKEISNETTSISVNSKCILITLKNGQSRLLKQDDLQHIDNDDFYLMNSESDYDSFIRPRCISALRTCLLH